MRRRAAQSVHFQQHSIPPSPNFCSAGRVINHMTGTLGYTLNLFCWYGDLACGRRNMDANHHFVPCRFFLYCVLSWWGKEVVNIDPLERTAVNSCHTERRCNARDGTVAHTVIRKHENKNGRVKKLHRSRVRQQHPCTMY